MSRASIETGLSISQFAEVLGLSKWLVNQWANPVPGQKSGPSSCDAMYQWMWQKNAIARHTLAEAISNAEQAIANYVGFYPAPKQLINEIHPFPKNLGKATWFARYLPSITTKYQKIVGVGTLTRTLIADVAVTYTDTDGDGIVDRFTAAIPTVLTDARLIQAYVRVADRAGDNLQDEGTWRITPALVSIASGVVTITGDPTIMMRPVLREGALVSARDPKNMENYLTMLSVMQVVYDPQKQGYVQYTQGTACCDGQDCTPENLKVCFVGQDWEHGIAYAKQIETDTNAHCRLWPPDMIYVNYSSGVEPLADGRMRNDYAQAVAKLACTYLPLTTCGCTAGDQVLEYWRQDLTQDVTGGQFPGLAYQGQFASPLDSASPFGFTRGGMDAWRFARTQRQRA
jgi:hypothetical protein